MWVPTWQRQRCPPGRCLSNFMSARLCSRKGFYLLGAYLQRLGRCHVGSKGFLSGSSTAFHTKFKCCGSCRKLSGDGEVRRRLNTRAWQKPACRQQILKHLLWSWTSLRRTHGSSSSGRGPILCSHVIIHQQRLRECSQMMQDGCR